MIKNTLTSFSEQIKILLLKKVKETATESHSDLILWSDDFQLVNSWIEVRVTWQEFQDNWLFQKISLGIEKKIFDTELLEICNALEIALSDNSQRSVTVMLDSQVAITHLNYQEIKQEQHLALRAHQTVLILRNQSREMTIQWISEYQSIKENKRADQAAKQAVSRFSRVNQRELSLIFIRKACTESNRVHRQ